MANGVLNIKTAPAIDTVIATLETFFIMVLLQYYGA